MKIIDFLIFCCSIIILNSVNNFTNSFANTLENNINLYSLSTMKNIVPEWIEKNYKYHIFNLLIN